MFEDKMTPKELGWNAYMKGNSIESNPFKKNTIPHQIWKQEYIYASIEPDFIPFPEQRDIKYYLCAAMAKQGIFSEREFSEKLEKAPNFVNALFRGKTLPSDNTMIKIAEYAGLDISEALIDLSIWRSDGEAKKTYAKILQKMSQLCIMASVGFLPSSAYASEYISRTTSEILYIMENNIIYVLNRLSI